MTSPEPNLIEAWTAKTGSLGNINHSNTFTNKEQCLHNSKTPQSHPHTRTDRVHPVKSKAKRTHTHSLSFHPPAIKNAQISTAPGRHPISTLVQMSTFIWNASNISNTSRRHSQSQMRLQMRRLMPEGGRGSLSYPRQRPSCHSHDSGSHGGEISRDWSARHVTRFAETTTQKLVGIFPLNYSLAPSPLSRPPSLPRTLLLTPPPSTQRANQESDDIIFNQPVSFENASRISMRLVLSGAQAKLISIMVLHDHHSLNANPWSNTHMVE